MVELARQFREASDDSIHLRVVAVIPCLNAQNTITDVVTGSRKHVDEVIVVDDGCTDLTAFRAMAAGATVIKHDKNQGKGAAMKTGVANAEADIIVFIDGDGQHNPEEIPKLLAPILRGDADFVIGSRFMTGSKISSSPLLRRITNTGASIAISFIISILQPVFGAFSRQNRVKKPHRSNAEMSENEKTTKSREYRIVSNGFKWITDCTSGFTAVRAHNWDRLDLVSNGYQIEAEMIFEQAKNGFVIAETPVSCVWEGSSSRLSVIKDGSRTFALLIGKLFNLSGRQSPARARTLFSTPHE